MHFGGEIWLPCLGLSRFFLIRGGQPRFVNFVPFLSRQFQFVAKAERLRAGDDLERLTTLRGTNRRVFAFTIDADELRARLFACVQQIDSGDSAPTVAAPTFPKIGMMMFCTRDFT